MQAQRALESLRRKTGFMEMRFDESGFLTLGDRTRFVGASAQTIDQQRGDSRIREMADSCSKKLGLTRRRFLQTSGGMAVAMLAYNEIFGKTYEVDPVEALDQAAYAEKWPKTEFIFDNQTHHVDVESKWFEASETGRQISGFLRQFRAGAASTEEALAQLDSARC